MVKDLLATLKESKIAKDTIKIYIYQFISLALGMIISVVIARKLGAEGKGIVDLFGLQSNFIVEFGMLGFGSGILYYLANKKVEFKIVHGTAVVFCVAAGLAVSIIGITFISQFETIFKGLDKNLLIVGFIISPILFYKTIYSNLMVGLDKSAQSYKIGMYISALNILLVLICYYLNILITRQVIYLTISISIVSVLIFFIYLSKVSNGFRFDKLLLKNALKFGIAVYVGNLANVLQFRVDQILINNFIGTSEMGIYNVSVKWAEMLFLLDGAVMGASLFKISSLEGKDSFELTNRLFKVQALISGIGGIFLIIFSYPLIKILYGQEFIGAVVPLIILVPGIISWSISKFFSVMLSYNSNKAWFCTISTIAGLIINIILNLIILNLGYGISFIALSSSVSYTITALIIYLRFRRLGDREACERNNSSNI